MSVEVRKGEYVSNESTPVNPPRRMTAGDAGARAVREYGETLKALADIERWEKQAEKVWENWKNEKPHEANREWHAFKRGFIAGVKSKTTK